MGLFDKYKSNKILTPQERRNNTIEQLKKAGIATNPHLPLLEPGEQVTLKSTEEIEKRCLGNMLCIQLACSINNGENYGEALAFVMQYLEKWHISVDDLLPKERLLIINKYTAKDCTDELTKQNIIDVVWTYETYWSLIWALDLISDKELKNASKTCNTERATPIGNLNSEVVYERRRGLEWLISNEKDWHKISLNT